MQYYYYKETLQKTNPEQISFDTVKFILNNLADQNKKVWEHKINSSTTTITWIPQEGNTSTIVCKG